MGKEFTSKMKEKIKFIFILLISAIIFTQPVFSAASETPEPYEDEEFPQWALDLRRFEVVSLGSMPFAMIGVTLGYGAIEVNRGNMDSIPNPLNPGSNLSEDEQLKIFGMTFAVGLGIGLVDLVVNILKRNHQRKKLERLNATRQVLVVPVSQNVEPEAIEDSIVTDAVDDEEVVESEN